MFKLPKHNDRGFSLIELAVVVAIIGILAAIAIPTFLGQREAAQDRQSHSALRNSVTAARAEAASTDTSEFAASLQADLNAAEPSLDFVAGASTDADTVSVTRVSGDIALFASQSPSGTCWYVLTALQDVGAIEAGTSYAQDANGDPGDCDTSTVDTADDAVLAAGAVDHEEINGGSFGTAPEVDNG